MNSKGNTVNERSGTFLGDAVVSAATRRARANPKAGHQFEHEIETSIRHYASQGILCLKPTAPPVRVIGWGQQRRVIFLPNPFLDFIGAWTECGGLLLAIEAKETSEGRLAVNNRNGGVDRRQFDAMRMWESAGGVAIVLWRSPCGVRLLAMGDLRNAVAKGQRLRDTDGILVNAGPKWCPIDFIAALRRCRKTGGLAL